MNAKILFGGLALAGLLLGDAVMIKAQAPGDVTTQLTTVFGSLSLASVNAVDVWRLTCTSTPFLAAQTARARVLDRGGADGRRIYLHLTRTFNGRTAKTTAPDGTGLFSPLASVATGGAGSVHYVQVSKDRTGATVLGIPIAEPYTLQADCIAGGIVRPHILTLVQNQ